VAIQHALVTGAGSGIGRAIALALAREGLHVHLVGRDVAKLARTAACAHGKTTALAADLATREGIAAAGAACGPQLDLLVHSAGTYLRGPMTATTGAEWSALDAVNLHAPILLTSACLPALRAASGQVVFVNSSAGLRAGPGIGAYAAGKHALAAAVDVLRQELNPDGIRVLSVFPGRTDTPMQQAVLAAEGRSAGPGALMQPDDVAAMVMAALRLPRTAEVTDIVMRPMRPL
jgi:NADP-dependent 3-hydroxy acid dehydrogenase YdfG